MNLDRMKFRIEVSNNGKLQFYDLQGYREILLSNKGFSGFLQFNRISNDSSLEGMFKIYKWWVDIISDDLGEIYENTDDTLCQMFLSEERFNKITNKPMYVTNSKDSLSYQGWLSFLKKIYHLCTTELGYLDNKGESRLPIPNNLEGKL